MKGFERCLQKMIVILCACVIVLTRRSKCVPSFDTAPESLRVFSANGQEDLGKTFVVYSVL